MTLGCQHHNPLPPSAKGASPERTGQGSDLRQGRAHGHGARCRQSFLAPDQDLCRMGRRVGVVFAPRLLPVGIDECCLSFEVSAVLIAFVLRSCTPCCCSATGGLDQPRQVGWPSLSSEPRWRQRTSLLIVIP